MNVISPEMMQASIVTQPVNEDTCREWSLTLNKYRVGKHSVERRAVDAERWWKMRNSWEIQNNTESTERGFTSSSSWLHNVIANKHADGIEAYPQPNIVAREEGDKVEAWALTQIIPVILEYNHFESVYDEVLWQKLKTGTGIYKVSWDSTKNNGLGDVAVTKTSLLNLFWEPGIHNIQDSKMVFHTEVMDKDDLVEQYPELEGKRLDSVVTPTKMPHDDNVSDDNKVVVIDVYYKKHGKLHYAKYVGETVLYATENDPERAEVGLYTHGLYPYVFDTLFPIEDSPTGYGYIDIGANAQIRIDIQNTACLRNSMAGATPRYFVRADGGINEDEFLNVENTLVHVNGNLGEESIRVMEHNSMDGNYINLLEQTVQELRETTGNTETATGSSVHGVTAASAVAAMQEASGKLSRASTLNAYRAYQEVINLIIELIRQFYDLPRQFRITGQMGVDKYIEFSNQGMQPQPQGFIGGVDMGYRIPVYDVKVEAEKKNRYTQAAQNELAKELFNMGLFNPENVNQALLVLDMMDFDGKDRLMQKLAQQGTMYQTLIQWQQFGLTMAAQYRPDMVQGLANNIMAQNGQRPTVGNGKPPVQVNGFRDYNKDGVAENTIVEKARERSNTASQPN